MRALQIGSAVAATIVLLASPARAQTPPPAVIDARAGMTIEEAIQEALRAEPTLAAMRAELAVSAGEREQSALRPNPSVMFEQREQAGGSDRQTTIGAELPLDVFARQARIQFADKSLTVVQARVDDAVRQLAIAVRTKYGEVLAAARRLEIADELVDATRRTYELMRRRAEEGASPPLERDVALIELRRMESARELAAGRVTVAATELKRLLGRSAGSAITLRASLEATLQTGVLVAAVHEDRSDVREALAESGLAIARTNLAKQESKPELTLFGSYMKMDQEFAQSGFNALGRLEPVQGAFHNLAAGLRVSIPVFNRGQGNVAAAAARETVALDALRARRLSVESDISAATARVDAAKRSIAAFSSETRAIARQNLDVMRETYSLGRVPLFDVLNEQRRYLEFESSYTDALAELFAAVTALQGATGDIR